MTARAIVVRKHLEQTARQRFRVARRHQPTVDAILDHLRTPPTRCQRQVIRGKCLQDDDGKPLGVTGQSTNVEMRQVLLQVRAEPGSTRLSCSLWCAINCVSAPRKGPSPKMTKPNRYPRWSSARRLPRVSRNPFPGSNALRDDEATARRRKEVRNLLADVRARRCQGRQRDGRCE